MSGTGTRQRSHPLHQESSRRRLPMRDEPYRAVLGRGRWLGYRKGKTGESWYACWLDEDGNRRWRVLGTLPDMTYEAACRAANDEIDKAPSGNSDARYTVAQACRDYIEHKRAQAGDRAAKYAAAGLEPFVVEHSIGTRRLRDLTHRELERWLSSMSAYKTPAQLKGGPGVRRCETGRRPNTINRVLRTFRAALNYAKARKVIGSDAAWCDIKALKAREGQRDVYLDLAQRRALLGAANPDLRNFLLAMLYTAARPNEVRDLLVEDFSAKTGSVRIETRKGRGVPTERTTFLAPDAVALFREMSRGKLPKAPLLTRDGSPWRRHHWSRDLDRAVDRANAQPPVEGRLPEGIVAYVMRHTAISEWLQQGVNIGAVAKAAGTSVLMIERHYQKFIKPDFVEKLAAIQVV